MATDRRLLYAAGLLLVTALTYFPVARAGFVWDDDDWVTENPAVVSDRGYVPIWTEVAQLQYYPLLYTAFRFQHGLWGDDPRGYHLVNVGLHLINALLVWWVAARLGVPGAFWVAAVFAVHPVHVESVAWVTELKNVLSGALALGAVGCFTLDRRGSLWLSLALFTAAMLTKTAVAPLPAVLFLLALARGRPRPVVVAPFFAVAAVLALITVRLESGMVAHVGQDFDLSLLERIAVGVRAAVFYPAKLLVPWPVMFHYPRWDPSALANPALSAVAGGVALVALFRAGERRALAALAVYVAMISPVLGVFDVYWFRYSFVADHFQYLASLGVFGAVAFLAHRLRLPPSYARGALGAVVAILAVTSHIQVRAYESRLTLWTDTVEKNPGSWLAHHGLGLWWLERDDPHRARAGFEAALTAKPSSHESLTGRGAASLAAGNVVAAIEDLDRALELAPGYPEAHLKRGAARVTAGEFEEALPDLDAFLRARPDSLEALGLRARAFQGAGRLDRSLADLTRAIELGAGPTALVDRAVISAGLGDREGAFADLSRAVELAPDAARGWVVRGTLYRQAGDVAASCEDWGRACELGDCSRARRFCR